jgi:hypothetical protein
MATETTGPDISEEASADLSSNQFYLVKPTSSGLALTGAGEAGYALQNKPDAAGKAGTFRISGVSKVVTGAAVSIGDYLSSDASGKAVTATAGQDVAGQALEASAADGVVIKMLVLKAPSP